MRNSVDPKTWWSLSPGPGNAITDIEGVLVGQQSLTEGSARTGVTAILPREGDLFREPVVAAAEVHNGFGKSAGLIQVSELGEIETPILLTNTFGVPACSTALIRRAIASNPEIGRAQSTVNALVLECNDGGLNDIQALHVTEEDAVKALRAASSDVAQGSIGAGTGMRSFGYAGGIGTSSRHVGDYLLGALVLSNFGQMSELRVMGQRIPPAPLKDEPDQGSIIIILATDAPLDSRQLGRICRRSPAALGRLGSYLGHGSGDITVGFTTAKRNDYRLRDAHLDPFFLAAVEVVEEAVLNALWHGEARPGYDGLILPAFRPHYEAVTGQGG